MYGPQKDDYPVQANYRRHTQDLRSQERRVAVMSEGETRPHSDYFDGHQASESATKPY